MITRLVCPKCTYTEPGLDGKKCLDCFTIMLEVVEVEKTPVQENEKDYVRKTCKAVKCAETPSDGSSYCEDHKSHKGKKTKKGKYDTR